MKAGRLWVIWVQMYLSPKCTGLLSQISLNLEPNIPFLDATCMRQVVDDNDNIVRLYIFSITTKASLKLTLMSYELLGQARRSVT